MTAKINKSNCMARQVSNTSDKMESRSDARGTELTTELETFEQKLPELLETAIGKFVVIKSREILGIVDDYAGALRLGYSLLGSEEPFFVERVEDPEIKSQQNKVFLARLECLR